MKRSGVRPSQIKNKFKRVEVYHKQKAAQQKEKLERRRKRKREEAEAVEQGLEAPPKKLPRTLESVREIDDTFVDPEDDEVAGDEATDEFADYFAQKKSPKLIITTKRRPTSGVFPVIKELLRMIPNSFYYKRGVYAYHESLLFSAYVSFAASSVPCYRLLQNRVAGRFELKQICRYASNREFTHLIVLGEKAKKVNSMLVVHLPSGPTAFFRLTNLRLSDEIRGRGVQSRHLPEIILNNFNTRLGHRVGRMVGSLFPHNPQFRGRRVVTFHNQRDFIFLRQHRYEFAEEGKRAKLQELGPRFTLKMRWLLSGTFDTKMGEYEWFHRRHEMDLKRKFHL